MDPTHTSPEKGGRWVWCRFGAHWTLYKASHVSTRINACSDHTGSYRVALQRLRRSGVVVSLEKGLGSGRSGGFCPDDYSYYVFRSHSWVQPTGALDGMSGQGKYKSTLNLPSADDELLCGCVPGWPHGEMCGDGLTGQPCRQPD